MLQAAPDLLSWLRSSIYPHYYWAREIIKVLREHGISDNATIIDAPCGEGIIAYWIAKSFPGNELMLIDRDKEALAAAARLLPSAQIIHGDLFELPVARGDDVWLLINSLYLLPNPAKLVNLMHSQATLIVGIFPYLEHRNYRCFMKNNPDFENPHAMSQRETLNFFERCGYGNLSCTPLTPIPYHCMRLPTLNGLLRRLFLALDPLLPAQKGAYWLGVFERN